MIQLKQLEAWFVTGSQHLYGEETLQQVAAHSQAIAAALDDPATAQLRARALRERIFQHFSQKAMVEGVLDSYREAFTKT